MTLTDHISKSRRYLALNILETVQDKMQPETEISCISYVGRCRPQIISIGHTPKIRNRGRNFMSIMPHGWEVFLPHKPLQCRKKSASTSVNTNCTCISDEATVRKTRRRAVRQGQSHNQAADEYQGTSIYRGTRYRASDAPSQSTTNTENYIDIVDTSSHSDQQSTSDNDHYDKPDVYVGLDVNAVTPPTPSVYDNLSHWLRFRENLYYSTAAEVLRFLVFKVGGPLWNAVLPHCDFWCCVSQQERTLF